MEPIMLQPTMSTQSQDRPGLFGRISNFFGADDPNAGTPTDPFANLSRAQRTMLGFAALRDAAAALEGRDSNFFQTALGGFESARERERLREQGEFANRNQQMMNLIQLQALARAVDDPALEQYASDQLATIMGSAGLGVAGPTVIRAGATVPTPTGGGMATPGDFMGGTMPADVPTGPQGVTGPPPTGVAYEGDGVTPMPYSGEPETTVAPETTAQPVGPAATGDPLADIDARIAEQERTINQLIGDLPGRERVLSGQMAGLNIGVSPQEQASLDQAISLRNELMAERRALIEGQPEREAAALASEDAARQARYNRGVIESIINSPNLGGVVGRFEGQTEPGTAAGAVLFNEDDLDLLARINQLDSQVFLQGRDMLRGGGQITDFEGQRAQEALSRIGQRGVSEEAYRQALRELDQVFANAEARSLGQPVPFPDIDTDPRNDGAQGGSGGAGGATHRYNPATGQIEAIR